MISELGRLCYDIKLESVGENKKVVNNRIAIQQGKDKTTFVDIVAWGNNAELLEKYFKKGYEIYIEGHLINKKYKKNETEFDTVAILVEYFKFTYGNHKSEEGELQEYDGDVSNFLR